MGRTNIAQYKVVSIFFMTRVASEIFWATVGGIMGHIMPPLATLSGHGHIVHGAVATREPKLCAFCFENSAKQSLLH